MAYERIPGRLRSRPAIMKAAGIAVAFYNPMLDWDGSAGRALADALQERAN